MDKPQAMLFDLDGTLFKTETLLIPAFEQAFEQMRKEGSYQGQTPDQERILSCLGMLLEDIWKHVLPDSSAEVRERANELLLHFQLEGLRNGVGELYPGVESTLSELHRNGVRLFVASNGLEGYVKGVIQWKGLSPLFEGLYSAGEYETSSKVDLVRLLLKTHDVSNAWMVGDRSSDVEAGKKNGLTVAGCDYAGFGGSRELNGADFLIKDFSALLEFI